MKLNKVILKNYRNHSQLEVTFDRGINLLLGKNGAGKSSVLEAVGLALFNVDGRSALADAVKRGEKSATILVEFEGNDGNQYVAERKFGSVSRSRLMLKGDKASRVEGSPVFEKIKELAGIELNAKNIYRNVVTAYQNRFATIFAEKNSIRERIFNEIFDTAIYRDMYDKFTKDALTEYETSLRIEESSILETNSKMKDPSEVKKVLKEKKILKKQLASETLLREKEKKQFEEKRESLRKKKFEIEKTEKEILHKKELINSSTQYKNKTEENLKESIQAKKIVDLNEKAYKKYLQLEDRKNELNSEKLLLEKKETLLNRKKEQQSQLLLEIEKGKTEKKALTQSFEREKMRIAEESVEVEQLKKDISEFLKHLDSKEHKGKLFRKFEQNFNLKHNKLLDLVQQIKLLQSRVDILDKNLGEKKQYQNLIATYKKEKAEIEQQKKIKIKLESDLNILSTRVNELKKASIELGEGVCPILKEQCLNIGEKGIPLLYFDSREKELSSEVDPLNKKLVAVSGIDSQHLEIIRKIEMAQAELNQYEKRVSERKEILNLITIAEKETKIISLEIEILIKELPSEYYGKEFDTIAADLKDKVITLRSEYQSMKKEIEIKKISKNKLSEKIQKMVDENSIRDHKAKTLHKTITDYEKEKKHISDTISSIQIEIKTLPEVKERLKITEKELLSLKQSYDDFMKFSGKASDLEKYEKQLNHSMEKIKKSEQDYDALLTMLNSLNETYNFDDYENIRNSLTALDKNLKIDNETLSSLKTEIALYESDLKQIALLLSELKEKQKRRDKLRKKIDLTKLFRNNIRSMGKYVGDRLIRKIEISATDNFRKITGRTEQIKWKNSQDETYSVYLVQGSDQNSGKKFEILSGGEQVAVALSLRAAMAENLTTTDFAIFDEPTINLDSEKRIALAESLKEILGGLRQAIIVTHDGTFREMAQKIINM